VADEYTVTLTIEASGEVAPATEQAPEADESPTDKEMTDG